MSKLFKGRGKAVKGIFKGIGKIFKKITSSTLGKIILAAVVIWTAGAAFGLEGFSTGTGIDNIFAGVTEVAPTLEASGAAAAAAGPGGAALGGIEASTGYLAGTQGVGSGVLAASEVSSVSGTGLLGGIQGIDALGTAESLTAGGGVPTSSVLGANAPTEMVTPGSIGTEPLKMAADQTTKAMSPLETMGLEDISWGSAEKLASTASTSGGFLGGIGGKIAGAGAWMQAHPIPSLMGMGFLQGAFSPDQEDLLERQEELRRERYGSLASVGNVNIGFKPPNRPGVLRSKATGAPVYKGGGILSRLRERSSIYSGGTQNA